MATPKWFLILRDVTLLALGVFGVLHQELSGQADPILLAVYTTLLGIPGAANVLAILKAQPQQPEEPATSAGESPPSSSQESPPSVGSSQ